MVFNMPFFDRQGMTPQSNYPPSPPPSPYMQQPTIPSIHTSRAEEWLGGGFHNIQAGISQLFGKMLMPSSPGASAGQWLPMPMQSTALITGASSGIGKEIAKLFAQHSINLIMVSDETTLNNARQEIAQLNPFVRVHPIICDLSLPNGPFELYNEVKRLGLTVDILVNNASIADFGLFANQNLEKLLKVINLDMVAMMRLCYYFGRDMLSRGHGSIINISSIHAFAPSPHLAVYGACGTFIYNFSRALAFELKDSGVAVTCVCPGPTRDTMFTQRSGVRPEDMPRVYKGWLPSISPQRVAMAALAALFMRRSSMVPGFTHQLKAFLVSVLPTELALWIENFLNSPGYHRQNILLPGGSAQK
jgi:short-subunit dehydrogenase